MENRRVVITGMGVVAPNGIGVDNFWDSLVNGRSGVRKITHFDASSYPCQVAAEVSDFDPTDYMDPKTAKRLSRFAQFALASSRMVIGDAEIDLSKEDPFRIGVCIGTGIGGGDFSENQHIVFMEKGLKRISPYTAMAICTHSAAGIICSEYGIKGVNTTIAAGCNSGLDAASLAYNAIRLGDADIMFTGAGEAPITPYIFGIFCAGGFLSKENREPHKALKPYDIDGDGTVLGEGGAMLVMEELQHAKERGAKIFGELLSYSSVNDACNLFQVENNGETLAKAMGQSLKNAKLNVQDIDYINAHGNGLPEYDANETTAIKKTFGELAYQIPINSIKPITGQSFSVTGILQMITCFLVINKNIIPPTFNHRNPAADCDLDYVPICFRNHKVNFALMNAHGFGGSHTVFVVGRENNFNR
jgi:3-oxoacyl-[acyl-carrier-protein] synthase II